MNWPHPESDESTYGGLTYQTRNSTGNAQFAALKSERATVTLAVWTVALFSNWPDSGLTRNTQGFCYRCSVPGLAGFTKTAVVRSPKSDNLSKHLNNLNRRFAMGQHSQQAVNREMQ